MNIKDLNKDVYDKFILENSGSGTLKIRAYAASEALPVGGLNIIVSSVIDNDEVVFFRGVTDKSGMIPNIKLPAPKIDFSINMYDGICVVQNINFLPGGSYGR